MAVDGDTLTLTLAQEDVSNLRIILGRAFSSEREPDEVWRNAAGRLYNPVTFARDAANPGGDKSAPFRPDARAAIDG